ncbi:hypothetical protein [Pseudoalteromonas rubra]|uniref:Uncharacterized protein n=1 Tax=Pseudoalteromonas rubra TaxID=43658 RepID=A0A5S3X6N0_9GAMM|nr:hypothetical protein [Pseudoalteromonas rubra]TMP39605.1 hypothetical protein CWB98_03185 [Pseudoalteromonas rubra]
MKLSLNKKKIKSLSQNSTLSAQQTPQVGGAVATGFPNCPNTNFCNSINACWTFKDNRPDCIIWG